METTTTATVSDENERPKTEPLATSIDARTVALAAAVESLSTGHARVLAAELRARLEALSGAAEVVSISSKRHRH